MYVAALRIHMHSMSLLQLGMDVYVCAHVGVLRTTYSAEDTGMCSHVRSIYVGP